MAGDGVIRDDENQSHFAAGDTVMAVSLLHAPKVSRLTTATDVSQPATLDSHPTAASLWGGARAKLASWHAATLVETRAAVDPSLYYGDDSTVSRRHPGNGGGLLLGFVRYHHLDRRSAA